MLRLTLILYLLALLATRSADAGGTIIAGMPSKLHADLGAGMALRETSPYAPNRAESRRIAPTCDQRAVSPPSGPASYQGRASMTAMILRTRR